MRLSSRARRRWCLIRAREAFVDLRGLADAHRRTAAIAQLPQKRWRGARVYAIVCRADFGIGPHVQWVPAYVLWSLIDLRGFCCPYHR